MLDATDNQYRLLGKRMEWISDYRFERQTPGIMNLLSNTGARISPASAGRHGQALEGCD